MVQTGRQSGKKTKKRTFIGIQCLSPLWTAKDKNDQKTSGNQHGWDGGVKVTTL